MRFYKKLYVSDPDMNIRRIKWKLKHNAGQIQLYIIALSENNHDQLEIYHCSLLMQKYYHKKEHGFIIGFSKSYDEAVEIVRTIARESMKATGTCDLKYYLLNYRFKTNQSDEKES